MDVASTCSHCGLTGVYGQSFEVYGKYNGYPAFRCLSCGGGSYITNAGRAMITKRAHSVRIPDSSWNEMKRITGDESPKTPSEPPRPEPPSVQFLDPDDEFANLIDAIRQCRDNLQKIVDITQPWREGRKLVVPSDHELIKIELLRLLRVICDRKDPDDDVLASFILFFIEADLDSDIDILRDQLEQASFFGSSSLFEGEQSLFPIDGATELLLSPSDFYRFYCCMPDLALLVNEMEAQVHEVYLGAVAQFGLAASNSTVLASSRASSFGRTATFCSTHMQFAAHMKSSPYEGTKNLLETFEFSVTDLDIAQDLRDAIGCMAFLEDDYLTILGNVFESLAALDRARGLDEDDEDDDDYDPAVTDSDLSGGDYRSDSRERLIALQELYEEGLISTEELQLQRSRILGEI